jgi:hypothetical protein
VTHTTPTAIEQLEQSGAPYVVVASESQIGQRDYFLSYPVRFTANGLPKGDQTSPDGINALYCVTLTPADVRHFHSERKHYRQQRAPDMTFYEPRDRPPLKEYLYQARQEHYARKKSKKYEKPAPQTT